MSDSTQDNAVTNDRELLKAAHAHGPVSTVLAYFRLSGPGWLQSAITLGGGSLTSALFLGVLGGYQMLWLQLIAIILGVIMLSAISFVTLASKMRPFQAINQHINPILGCGWLLATVMANVIWCMPQFSLCYDALNKGLLNSRLEVASVVALPVESAETTEPSTAQASSTRADTAIDVAAIENKGTVSLNLLGKSISIDFFWPKMIVSFVLLSLAFTMVVMSSSGGKAGWWFDVLLKVIIGVIVLCFFGTVLYLSAEGKLPWNEIANGFIPNLYQWTTPSSDLAALLETLPEDIAKFWNDQIVQQQRSVMISTIATAVGINMTFLLPYSLLARGWDRTFQGLARFDLIFGMMIPFVLVTTCVVISSAAAFHAKADRSFLSSDAAMVQKSPLFGKAKGMIEAGYAEKLGADYSSLSAPEKTDRLASTIASLSEAERRLTSSLVKRDSFDLSQSLAPLFRPSRTTVDSDNATDEDAKILEDIDETPLLFGLNSGQVSSLVFSVGALAMGFSTIIILMLINGYAIAELFQVPAGSKTFLAGALLAGISGAAWPFIWQGESKLWLAISASTFGFLLLPIAYFSFILLINSKKVLGDDRPEGLSRIIWNVLLCVSLIATVIAAVAALIEKLSTDAQRGDLILGAILCFVALAVIGFFATNRNNGSTAGHNAGRSENIDLE